MNRLLIVFLSSLLTVGCAKAGGPSPGGGTDVGGGGYQYPNSRLLLTSVANELADEIETLDDSAFREFPSGWDRARFAALVRGVVSKANDYRERPNAAGEPEGLMFDYSANFCEKGSCGPKIIALRPFFDAYKGQPIKEMRKQPAKAEMYALIVRDVKVRLLHEASHLLGIGQSAALDYQSEQFAESMLKKMATQLLVCESSSRKSRFSIRTSDGGWSDHEYGNLSAKQYEVRANKINWRAHLQQLDGDNAIRKVEVDLTTGQGTWIEPVLLATPLRDVGNAFSYSVAGEPRVISVQCRREIPD